MLQLQYIVIKNSLKTYQNITTNPYNKSKKSGYRVLLNFREHLILDILAYPDGIHSSVFGTLKLRLFRNNQKHQWK